VKLKAWADEKMTELGLTEKYDATVALSKKWAIDSKDYQHSDFLFTISAQRAHKKKASCQLAAGQGKSYVIALVAKTWILAGAKSVVVCIADES
jgi:hypothetical protein